MLAGRRGATPTQSSLWLYCNSPDQGSTNCDACLQVTVLDSVMSSRPAEVQKELRDLGWRELRMEAARIIVLGGFFLII